MHIQSTRFVLVKAANPSILAMPANAMAAMMAFVFLVLFIPLSVATAIEYAVITISLNNQKTAIQQFKSEFNPDR